MESSSCSSEGQTPTGFRYVLICVLLGWISGAIQAEPAGANAPDGNPTLVFRQFVADQPIKLVAYGDMRFTDPAVTSGTNPRVRKWLADRIAEEHPDVLLLTGDMPFTGGNIADWQIFQAETARWRDERIVQLPAPGNHEVRGDKNAGIANYLANFPAIAKHRGMSRWSLLNS